jgi:site-specific recombinase XerD
MRVVTVRTDRHRERYVVVDDVGDFVRPVGRFLKHLDDRGYARNTLRAYAYSLALYFTYLGEHGLAFEAVGIRELAGFVHWLKLPHGTRKVLPLRPTPQARTERTINAHLSAVMGFYDYLWRAEELDRDVTERLRTSGGYRPFKGFLHHLGATPIERHLLRQAEPRRTSQPTLSRDQINALAKACLSLRDRLLVQLLFETGMRPGEVLALWLEDVRIHPPQLVVVDRGQLENLAEIKRPASERELDVSSDLINRLLEYVTMAHTEDVSTNHVFLKEHGTRRGAPMDYADLRAMFLRLGQRADVAATAYLLRHTSLTNLARAGWAPEHLQVRAGHRHFQTTYNTYVHPDPEGLRAEWERTQHVTSLGG